MGRVAANRHVGGSCGEDAGAVKNVRMHCRWTALLAEATESQLAQVQMLVGPAHKCQAQACLGCVQRAQQALNLAQLRAARGLVGGSFGVQCTGRKGRAQA